MIDVDPDCLRRVAPSEYPESEYRASLWRAFIRGKADYIMIDGRSGKFLSACTTWALDNDYLQFDQITSNRRSDEQWTTLVYRLTDKGREMLKSEVPA